MLTSNSQAKIVIADDDVSILDALTMIMGDEGYTIIALSGGDILGTIVKEKPDLVVLDIWLSGQDGRDICVQLRNLPRIQKIPVVMISASRDAKETAYAAGADVFISKPFDIEEFLGTIQGVLKARIKNQ